MKRQEGNLLCPFTALVRPGRFDLMPVRDGPSVERGKCFIERVPEIAPPVESRGLNAPGVHMAHDQSVTFGSSERVRKDLR
jgi:hypothetical protein